MIKDGMLSVGEQTTDFLMGNTTTLPNLYMQDEERYEYNQGSSLDCTLYSSFGALSDLKNYKFNDDEIKEMVAMSYARDRVIGRGWYTQMGVKTVCDWWNENNDDKVAYFRVDLTSDIAMEAIEKNYTLVVSYKGNGYYNIDYLRDGELNGNEFGTPTYGHATTLINKKRIKDSYKGRKGLNGIPCNIYDIKSELKDLVSNGVYYSSAYIIVNVDDGKLEDLKRLNAMKIEVEKAIESHSNLWELTNDEGYRDFLHKINNQHRNKLKDIQIEFDKRA